jgi:hypothetical protein
MERIKRMFWGQATTFEHAVIGLFCFSQHFWSCLGAPDAAGERAIRLIRSIRCIRSNLLGAILHHETFDRLFRSETVS